MRSLDVNKTYLITGGAGFIGFYLSKALLEKGAKVIGIDNMNDYYEVSLKEDRLSVLNAFPGYHFVKGDISDKETVFHTFQEFAPHIVVNLAAQAGVRYSIDNPDAYIQSNIVGFFHVLEACRHFPVEHFNTGIVKCLKSSQSSMNISSANVAYPFLTIAFFSSVSNKASLLLVPYILWVLFATYLNISIAILN